jgi:hypothetical protein
MGGYMKTTIELSDAILDSAKALAQQNKTTLRALVEEGLRHVLLQSRADAKPAFVLKDASVKGQAVLMGDPGDWQKLEEEHVIARVFKGRK